MRLKSKSAKISTDNTTAFTFIKRGELKHTNFTSSGQTKRIAIVITIPHINVISRHI